MIYNIPQKKLNDVQNNGYLKIAQYFVSITVDQRYFQLINSPICQLFILNILWLKVNDMSPNDMSLLRYPVYSTSHGLPLSMLSVVDSFLILNENIFSIVVCLCNFHYLFPVFYS